MKSYELLKELLVVREYGAFGLLDESISLAIDVYCEDAGLSREQVINDITFLHGLIFYRKDWSDKQTEYVCQYQKLLNMYGRE